MRLIVLPNLAPSGTLAYQWLDPSNTLRNLYGSSVNVEVGERGLGVPTPDLAEDKLPFGSGTIVRHVAIASREIELPLLFEAASAAVLEALLDNVHGWFATADETTKTPGYLRVTRQDGTQRQVACYYAGGLEGDLSSERAGDRWQSAVVLLKAADPWATDIADSTASWDQTDIGDSVAIMNAGQLDAYPIWTITGPAAGISILNETTQKSFALTADGGLTLTGGQVLAIDTRRADQLTDLPVLVGGTSQFSKLTAASSLFTLLGGQNNFVISASGTSGATAFELAYRQRYRALLR